MKYTAQDETQAANITLGEAKCCTCHKGRSPSAIFVTKGEAQCYICHKTLIKSYIFSYKQSGSVLSVLLYFTLTKVSVRYSSLVIHIVFFNKMCQ